jgi:hypothetical protein
VILSGGKGDGEERVVLGLRREEAAVTDGGRLTGMLRRVLGRPGRVVIVNLHADIVETTARGSLTGVFTKIAKVVGFVGGVAALVWAMRDRFISVAVSREPAPPQFRTPQPDLEAVSGIGPTYAERLRDAGYAKAPDLRTATAADVAEAAGVSESRADDWIQQVQRFS